MTHRVTVRFVGVCTHISRASLLGLPAQQRVVLVNARQGKLVRDTPIPAHAPGLRIGPVEIEFHGCTLRLVTENSSSIPLIITDTFHKLPNLTELVGDLTTLGEPSAEVVLDANPEHSSCYFDIDFGMLSACVDTNGAAVATLVVESAHAISLEIAKWDGSGTDVVELLPDAIVWIANIDPPEITNQYPYRDFLLHYLTAAMMPAVPQIPQSFDLPECSFAQLFDTVGAGCSNSNYP